MGIDTNGNEVFLKDIWPSNNEIRDAVEKNVSPEMFKKQYSNALDGPKEWQGINTSTGDLFKWDSSSTYVQQPPFFTGQSDDKEIIPIILCGGSGTRLWPISRQSFPKQFLSLDIKNKKTLLQNTIQRTKGRQKTMETRKDE